MMRSASREALEQLRTRVRSASTGDPAALTSLAGELYAVADVLVGQPRLRRLIGDPATSAGARAELVQRVFGGKVSAEALPIVQLAATERWSSPWDLTDALELSGDDVLFAAADAGGVLDEVEDELFRFERVLESQSQLTTVLDEAPVPAERRVALLRQLLDHRANPITVQLLSHAVASQRKRSVTLAIDDLLEAAAARRERSVARIISATPLSDIQFDRLTAGLSRLYGRPISIRSAVDPAVRGGLVIRVGDEIIDGSIATRLSQARSALAG